MIKKGTIAPLMSSGPGSGREQRQLPLASSLSLLLSFQGCGGVWSPGPGRPGCRHTEAACEVKTGLLCNISTGQLQTLVHANILWPVAESSIDASIGSTGSTRVLSHGSERTLGSGQVPVRCSGKPGCNATPRRLWHSLLWWLSQRL